MSGLVALRAVLTVALTVGSLALAHPHPKEARAEQRFITFGWNLTTPEIIAAMGYPVEIHHITTPDGYILELHRIPYGVSGSGNGSRGVAMLQHCLQCSSAEYIENTPDQALAYVMADAGYDVWINNARGNRYSRAHVELDPDLFDFWRFSWDEIALIDVPTCIDYILATTGQEDLYYVGYSMGTTAFFALMSARPEYNSKVRVMGAYAPVVYCDYFQGLMGDISPVFGAIDAAATLAGVGEMSPWSLERAQSAAEFCSSEYAAVCYDMIFYTSGPDEEELNKELVPVVVAHSPSGTSYHTYNHYAQLNLAGKFQMYDFGRLGNLDHYGQEEPPLYNLSQVTAPVGLFWGQTDWVGTPEDVAHLAEELPNVALNYRVDKDEFNHVDFVWSIHTYEYVHRHLLDFFANY